MRNGAGWPKYLLMPAMAGLFSTCTMPPGEPYEARIRWTSYGIPHVEARDLGSLGFGDGYAQARDHLCDIADQVVRARGERSRFFGRGPNDRHLNSDLGMRALNIYEWAGSLLERDPPEIREWYDGFAAGYNTFLEQTAKEAIAGWCRGAEWVGPIQAVDLIAYHRIVTLVSVFFGKAIGAAQPPAASQAAAAPSVSLDSGRGSNGWALGRDRTESGGGMLVSNPHYPWVGSNRFWEKHLTIPGELDVYGVSLVGFPGVHLGFNKDVAWTHTTSAGKRFTLYSLGLVEGHPTRYHYDDGEREMTSRTVDVEVRSAHGVVETVTRTLYFSHYGPIVNMEGLEWTVDRAISIREANESNDDDHRQVLEFNRAESLEEFQQAHADYMGVDWVNTISVSSDGRAWYADTAPTPRLSQEALAAWQERTRTDETTRSLWSRGMVLLDGSNSLYEWGDPENSQAVPVLSYNEMPRLERRDYVFNSNDSYWLPHHEVRITGFSLLQGGEATPRSLRTRMNATTLGDLSPDGPAGSDGKFSLEEMGKAILHNRSLAAELLLPELVERCRAKSLILLDGRRTDRTEACQVLSEWDGRYNLESSGAVLFREFVTRYNRSQLRRAGALFGEDFDPSQPVVTPRGLAPAGPDPDPILHNLARAARVLEAADLPLDVPLGQVQFSQRGSKRIPIHGGLGTWEGIQNLVRPAPNRTTLEPAKSYQKVADSRYLTTEGYPIGTGTSFLLAIEFGKEGPRRKAFLTYGQSEDPNSRHFWDQTELFSQKKWRPVLFSEESIQKDVQEEMIVLGEKSR